MTITVTSSPPPPASGDPFLELEKRQKLTLMDRLTGQAPKTEKTQSLMSAVFSLLGACFSCKCCCISESQWLTQEIRRDSTWGQPASPSPRIPEPDPL